MTRAIQPPPLRWSLDTVESDAISVVDDVDVDFARFFDVTRLGIARDGLA